MDVTVVDTVAQSHVALSRSTAVAAADKAEDFQCNKYHVLVERFFFLPSRFRDVRKLETGS